MLDEVNELLKELKGSGAIPESAQPVILVVKDDKQLLDLLIDLLKPEGYHVLAATSDAIRRVGGANGAIMAQLLS